MQSTELKAAAFFYSYFLFLNRNNFIAGYLVAELFAEHIQAAERIAQETFHWRKWQDNVCLNG